MNQPLDIKALIGLGNPGQKYYHNRHNIGFQILDVMCERHNGSWQARDIMETAEITIGDKKIVLIKPQTFMNSSGKVIPFLNKKGIKPENILVVHDELELPFGTVKIKVGGSAKGHNGLRSIIEQCGLEFARLRFGIGRPAEREQVPDYVLQDFNENTAQLQDAIAKAVTAIEELFI
ncbi:MAG TPA: aminoacyl-tRNA hydrolase [Candidatus Limnocylindria bacterium]|nr:aminoacyl-tRNA hydrolase [Candidatus Limnocylindria bacterium]